MFHWNAYLMGMESNFMIFGVWFIRLVFHLLNVSHSFRMDGMYGMESIKIHHKMRSTTFWKPDSEWNTVSYLQYGRAAHYTQKPPTLNCHAIVYLQLFTAHDTHKFPEAFGYYYKTQIQNRQPHVILNFRFVTKQTTYTQPQSCRWQPN